MKRDSHRERPPPLKIKKPQNEDIHHRHRPAVIHPFQQYRQPLIIQTFSPEVIQTDPHDFMALVQKLTGRDILSPLHKKPCVGAGGPRDMASIDPNSYNLFVQQNQRNVLGLSGFNPPPTRPALLPPPRLKTGQQSLGLGAAAAAAVASSSSEARGSSEDLNLRLGIGLPRSAAAWQTAANSILSPSKFDFSPSVLPSPSTFLKDFAFVPPFTSSSSSDDSVSLPSPKLAMEAAEGLRPALGFPSPGPLTKILADLPVLSPSAYKLLEEHPFSADSLFSPLSRSFGLPPRPPPPPNG